MKKKATDNVDTAQTTHISLCSGYGGIDLGLRRVIQNLRTVAYAEIEAFACENLLARMENGQLDAAPIWSNLKSFPWAEFSGKVDILSGGYPCQPFSSAGLRKGTDDPRHLWPFISAGIAVLRPSLCFFENVEGHISLGLPDVIEDLGRLGYRTTWGIFSAVECGAPHQRKRVFIMAHRKNERLPFWWTKRWEVKNWSEWSEVWNQSIRQGGVCGEKLAVAGGIGGETGLSGSFTGNGGQSGVADYSSNQAWPSRPGEPQHAWEPPRVVADTKSKRANRGQQLCDAECGQGRTLSWEFDPANEVVGNAESRKDHGRESRDLGEAAGEGRCGNDAADCAGKSVGNAASTGRQRSGGTDDSGWRVQGFAEPDGGRSDQEVESKQRQAEPTLGGDADGPTSGLDDAIVYAADCQPCECCDDVICWKCGGHYADCPCPGPNSSDY